MTNRKVVLGIGWLGLAAVGCGAKTMIGEVPDGSDPNQASLDPVGTMGHTCQAPQFAGDLPFDFPAGVAGVWTGYDETTALGVASDAIRLTLDHAADGTSQIHIVFGVAAPPPPATSATDLPPGISPFGAAGLVEGFSYQAHSVEWQAFGQQWRLRFMIDNAEPWGSWCRLQPSYATPDSAGGVQYGCLPNTGGGSMATADGGSTCYITDGSGHPAKTVPCAQFQLCNGGAFPCGCDACGCDMQVASLDGPGVFDILFDAASATGSGIHLLPAATN
jgi:hypothetical protein